MKDRTLRGKKRRLARKQKQREDRGLVLSDNKRKIVK